MLRSSRSRLNNWPPSSFVNDTDRIGQADVRIVPDRHGGRHNAERGRSWRKSSGKMKLSPVHSSLLVAGGEQEDLRLIFAAGRKCRHANQHVRKPYPFRALCAATVAFPHTLRRSVAVSALRELSCCAPAASWRVRQAAQVHGRHRPRQSRINRERVDCGDVR
jgi:hypothetical protein